MELRHGSGHIRITLVGANHAIAGSSHTEVTSSHTCSGFHKLVAEMMTGTAGQVSRIIVADFLGDSLLLEHLSHFLTLQVDGRHHDMARLLMQELDDALTQVGLHHVNAVLLQIRIHLALLGEHRLRLHHLLHVMIFQDTEHNLIEFLCILCPVHLYPATLQILGKHIKIIGKMGDGVHLDFRRMLAEVFPLRKFLRHLISLLTNRPEGSVVPGGLLYVLRKLRSSLGMFCTHSPAAKI